MKNLGVRRLALALIAAVACGATLAATAPATTTIASLDLSKPFATRTPWRFTATQRPPTSNDTPSGNSEPGAIALCLQKSAGAACDPNLQQQLRAPAFANDDFVTPHYLIGVNVVHPRGPHGRALLWVEASSVASGDGDAIVRTQVLAYDQPANRFLRVYDFITGHNNNQAIRLIEAGALLGDIITVEPTANAPYGFWVTVNKLTAGYAYAQVLRYRSATHYGDGNPLPVIDSEMANIEQRLGLWRPGRPLPLPAGPCPTPRLTHMELWCS